MKSLDGRLSARRNCGCGWAGGLDERAEKRAMDKNG